MKRLLCWLGLHSIRYTRPLTTMSECECVNCKRQFIDTMYGLFDK